MGIIALLAVCLAFTGCTNDEGEQDIDIITPEEDSAKAA